MLCVESRVSTYQNWELKTGTQNNSKFFYGGNYFARGNSIIFGLLRRNFELSHAIFLNFKLKFVKSYVVTRNSKQLLANVSFLITCT